MSHLRYVTLTGVDENTDLNELVQLSANFPFVEWGVLYDESLAGRHPRYPSLAWIERFATLAADNRLNIALHLCGSAVSRLRKLYSGPEAYPHRTPANESEFALLSLTERFGRVQLNTVAKLDHVPALRQLIQAISRSEDRTRVILQWHERHAPVCDQLRSVDAFEVLVDSSGGRGEERTDWPTLGPLLPRAGYAGGLGPDNLAEQLPRIAKAAGNRSFWVDMETKLRDAQDQFNLVACAKVLAIATEFDKKSRFDAGALYGDQLQLTQDLEGLWLDWFVGYALGYDMVVPPLDACRAVYHYRPEGRFLGFSPSDDGGLAIRLFHDEQIALTPLPVVDGGALAPSDGDAPDGEDHRPTWTAKALGDDGILMPGRSLIEAGLRAIVAKYLGRALSTNPVAPPPFGD